MTIDQKKGASRIGLVEIGSRSIRYLVVDVTGHFRFSPVEVLTISYSEIGVVPSILSLENANLLNREVEKLLVRLRQRDCDRTKVYGTALCRALDSKYPGVLASQIDRIPAEEEALAAWVAAFLCEDPSLQKEMTAIDLGNGSTEIVRAFWDGKTVSKVKACSVDIGSEILVSKFQKLGSKYPTAIRSEATAIAALIADSGIIQQQNQTIYLLGGVATKIGWLSRRGEDVRATYRPELVNGVEIPTPHLEELYRVVFAAYSKNPGVAAQIIDDRKGSSAEVLRVLSGAPFLYELCRTVSAAKTFKVSGYGVRHGMAFLLRHDLI